jgi:hypothetical protein
MTLKPWKPGQSGNPGGRLKKPLVQKALEEALTCDDSRQAKQIASKLISSALHGSVAAAKLILDFTEIKPAKSVASEKPEVLTKEADQSTARRAALVTRR